MTRFIKGDKVQRNDNPKRKGYVTHAYEDMSFDVSLYEVKFYDEADIVYYFKEDQLEPMTSSEG